MLKDILFGGAGGGNKLADIGMLIARLFVGLSIAFAHGLGKVQSPDGVIGGVRGMGFPMPEVFGWAATLSEFLGGILLALGLLTRPAAFFLAVVMSVAGFHVHSADPYTVKELAFLYLAPFMLFLLAGAGRFSVDALIRRGGNSKRVNNHYSQ